MNHDYYSIDEAAELIGHGVKDLIYLGAKGKLDIYFLPAGLVYISEKYDNGQVIERNRNEAITEPLKISRRTLEMLEAGNNDAVILLDYESNVARVIKRYHPIDKLDFIPYGISGMFGNPSARAARDFSEMFSEPAGYAQKARERAKEEYSDVKVNEVKLVIKHDGLMGLTTNFAGSKSNSNKPDQLTTLNSNTLEPNNEKSSCGTKAIHKLIDRAFYRVAETKNASDIKPSEVMDAIKAERQTKGQQLNVDVDAIIDKISQDEKNGGFEIHWLTSTRKTVKPFSYRSFSDGVTRLRNTTTVAE